MGTTNSNYGTKDATYRAAGEEQGVRKLVDAFYDEMDRNPEYRTIRELHRPDLVEARDRLARFLCAWMGGPRLYNQKYGAISIPGAHAHLHIGIAEREQWLDCMAYALGQCDYPTDLREYLLVQLAVPADRIVAIGEARRSNAEL